MIASISGEVLDIALDHVVIEAAGLGYRVNATPATIGALTRGARARLVTTLIVREDSMTLYGFPDDAARDLFSLLQTVSGVGPRLALAVLAVLEPAALTKALADGDTVALTRVPGIGKRSAERLVVELRDKVSAYDGASFGAELAVAGSAATASPVRDQVVEALAGLGFTAKQAEQATDSVLAQMPDADTPAVLRAALSGLGRSR